MATRKEGVTASPELQLGVGERQMEGFKEPENAHKREKVNFKHANRKSGVTTQSPL